MGTNFIAYYTSYKYFDVEGENFPKFMKCFAEIRRISAKGFIKGL